MIEKVSAGATGALGKIEMSDMMPRISSMVEKALRVLPGRWGIFQCPFSSDNLHRWLKSTAGATEALGKIEMTGYSADNLTSMVEKVASGATGALGKIKMTGYDASDLTGMMEKITSGATGSLGKIQMDGYSASKLSKMVEKITAGSTEALGTISMEVSLQTT